MTFVRYDVHCFYSFRSKEKNKFKCTRNVTWNLFVCYFFSLNAKFPNNIQISHSLGVFESTRKKASHIMLKTNFFFAFVFFSSSYSVSLLCIRTQCHSWMLIVNTGVHQHHQRHRLITQAQLVTCLLICCIVVEQNKNKRNTRNERIC